MKQSFLNSLIGLMEGEAVIKCMQAGYNAASFADHGPMFAVAFHNRIDLIIKDGIVDYASPSDPCQLDMDVERIKQPPKPDFKKMFPKG